MPTSVAAGDWVNCEDISDKWVRLSGTFTATIQFQVSTKDDKSEPTNAGSAQNAAAFFQLTMPAKWIRANVTAYTSGTPAAEVVGPHRGCSSQ